MRRFSRLPFHRGGRGLSALLQGSARSETREVGDSKLQPLAGREEFRDELRRFRSSKLRLADTPFAAKYNFARNGRFQVQLGNEERGLQASANARRPCAPW